MEGVDRFSVPEIPGCSTVFPVRPDGTEMNWGIKPEEARIRLQKGYLRAGKHTPNAPQQYVSAIFYCAVEIQNTSFARLIGAEEMHL